MTYKKIKPRKTYLELTNDKEYISYARGFNDALREFHNLIVYGDYNKIKLLEVMRYMIKK